MYIIYYSDLGNLRQPPRAGFLIAPPGGWSQGLLPVKVEPLWLTHGFVGRLAPRLWWTPLEPAWLREISGFWAPKRVKDGRADYSSETLLRCGPGKPQFTSIKPCWQTFRTKPILISDSSPPSSCPNCDKSHLFPGYVAIARQVRPHRSLVLKRYVSRNLCEVLSAEVSGRRLAAVRPMPPLHSRCIEIMLKALEDSDFIQKSEENHILSVKTKTKTHNFEKDYLKLRPYTFESETQTHDIFNISDSLGAWLVAVWVNLSPSHISPRRYSYVPVSNLPRCSKTCLAMQSFW